jgi:transcriptional regulator with XRE-family HTH domain
MKKPTTTLGKYIRENRNSLGKKQKDIAEALSITIQALSQWETGTRAPDTTYLSLLAKQIGVKKYELNREYNSNKPINNEVSQRSNDSEQLTPEDRLIETYFDVLRKKYHKANKQGQSEIRKDLESLVSK